MLEFLADRQIDKQTGQYGLDLSMQGHKKKKARKPPFSPFLINFFSSLKTTFIVTWKCFQIENAS